MLTCKNVVIKFTLSIIRLIKDVTPHVESLLLLHTLKHYASLAQNQRNGMRKSTEITKYYDINMPYFK